jgi:hypothetical protein
MNGMTRRIATGDYCPIATLSSRQRASGWMPILGISVFASGGRAAPSVFFLGLIRQRHY